MRFWRLRRQTALALIKIEDEDQDLRENASQSSNQRQQTPLIEEEKLSEQPEPPLSFYAVSLHTSLQVSWMMRI